VSADGAVRPHIPWGAQAPWAPPGTGAGPGGAPWSAGPAGVGGGSPGGVAPGGTRPEPFAARQRRRLIAAAAAIALVSAAVGGVTGAVVSDGGRPTVVGSAGLQHSASPGGGTSPAADGTVANAARKILPSVVTISEESGSESGTGSGMIIRSDGYILTNNHVVSGAAGGGQLTVTLEDGRTLGARVVGTDPSSDLAIIKINTTGLTAATFGDSEALAVGELVVAVGSPLGLNGTVTSGVVSSLHRPVRTGDTSVRDQNAVLDAIQTDAPINPGNSGGPLVNSRGEIVGINTAIATVGGDSPFGGQERSGNIGVGFAIPSNYAEKVAADLIATGVARHPYLGVSAATAGASASSPVTAGDGAEIRDLVSGGPAQRAGLRSSDVITRLGDRRVTDVDSLIAAVRSGAIGDVIEIAYTRDGRTETAKVTLAEQPR
jgi:putative serine protease PepD